MAVPKKKLESKKEQKTQQCVEAGSSRYVPLHPVRLL